MSPKTKSNSLARHALCRNLKKETQKKKADKKDRLINVRRSFQIRKANWKALLKIKELSWIEKHHVPAGN